MIEEGTITETLPGMSGQESSQINRKPLPPVPLTSMSAPIPPSNSLSILFHAHRARLIRFVLAESASTLTDSNIAFGKGTQSNLESGSDIWVESWASIFERALDELGENVQRGQWLSGIRINKEREKRNLKHDKEKGEKSIEKQKQKQKEAQKPYGDEGGERKKYSKEKDVEKDIELKRQQRQQLELLREFIIESEPGLENTAPTPTSRFKPKPQHLILCLASPSNSLAAYEEQESNSGSDVVWSSTSKVSKFGCSFTPGVFKIPVLTDDENTSALEECMLYGFREWRAPACPVGGTFTFTGLSSPFPSSPSHSHYSPLAKALRLSVYIHLSLLLEQQLLVDLNVKLSWAPVKSPTPTSTTSLSIEELAEGDHSVGTNAVSSRSGKFGSRSHRIPGGILSFFSRRSIGRFNSATSSSSASTSHPSSGTSSRMSLDSSRTTSFPSISESPSVVRSSMDDALRRFSFASVSPLSPGPSLNPPASMATPPSSYSSQSTNSTTTTTTLSACTSALSRLHTHKSLLSTSPGVVFEPPGVLVRVVEKTKTNESNPVSVSLMGDERVALNSLLGWNGSTTSTDATTSNSFNDKGTCMAGIPGFVNQQEISVLFSTHIGLSIPDEVSSTSTRNQIHPLPVPESAATSTSTPAFAPVLVSIPMKDRAGGTSTDSLAPSVTTSSHPTQRPTYTAYVCCTQPYPVSYRYWEYSSSQNPSLSISDHSQIQSQSGPGLRNDDIDNLNLDQPLGQILTQWIDEAEEPCLRMRLSLPAISSPAVAPSSNSSSSHPDSSSTPNPSSHRSLSPLPSIGGLSPLNPISGLAVLGVGGGAEKEKEKKCGMTKGRHERRWVHGGVRVSVGITKEEATSAMTSSTGTTITDGEMTRPENGDEGVREAEDKAGSKVGDTQENEEEADRPIYTWVSCSVCGASTKFRSKSHSCHLKDMEGMKKLSDAGWLFSFAKYLEVLIYSPLVSQLIDGDKEEEGLCEHTRPTKPRPKLKSESNEPKFDIKFDKVESKSEISTLSPERFNIVRHFSVPTSSCSSSSLRSKNQDPLSSSSSSSEPIRIYTVSFRTDPVNDVYELVVPTLQMHAFPASPSSSPSPTGSAQTVVLGKENEKQKQMAKEREVIDEDKKLRREIKAWWEGVADHLDLLEEKLFSATDADAKVKFRTSPTIKNRNRIKKALPRLPSTDEAYDSFDFDEDLGAPDDDNGVHRTGIRIGTGTEEQHTPKLTSGLGTGLTSTISGLPESTATPMVAATRDYLSKSSVKKSNSSTSPSTLTGSEFSSSNSTASGSVTPTSTTTGGVLRPDLPLNDSFTSSTSSSSSITTSSTGTTQDSTAPAPDPMELLSNLRQTFQRTEQTLYIQLSKTSAESLNDVRRAFLSAARGAERRLLAWQRKHLWVVDENKKKKGGKGHGKKERGIGKEKEKEEVEDRIMAESGASTNGQGDDDVNDDVLLNPLERLHAAEPEWWHPACHVVPEGNIIIREDDWGSIIAFTLSTSDYRRELATLSVTRNVSSSETLHPTTSTMPNTLAPPSSTSSSFFSAATATGYKLFRTSAHVQPDPDQEDVIWHEPEAYSAVISRKEHPRDPTSLLSIREVLRQKSPDSGILSGSRFASLGSSTSRLTKNGGGEGRGLIFGGAENGNGSGLTPPSAWAKPDVQVSKQAAEGQVEVVVRTHGDTSSLQRLLHGLDAVEGETESGSSITANYARTTSNSTIKRTPSATTVSDAHARPRLDDADVETVSVADSIDTQDPPASIVAPIAVKSSFSSLTSGITNAMRLVLPTTNVIPRPLSASSSSTTNAHHGLLSADIGHVVGHAIDERPHIKYDWTIGKRLKFSCTVYYAKQFDTLRKRCGLDGFVQSLSRSMNWSAEGGKSKSNFWKTGDDRFIIKTLVNAWNVADLQVLIELGPSYFRYMDSTANKATVLAKSIGFYTIEIRNLETGSVQSKADLLVMENIFHKHKVDKTFDLKGIQGRKVKPGNNATGQQQTAPKTLFDGEWIEGQQQTLTLVRPHSKAVLREAIRSDVDFLSRNNIMDYSLLLGINTEQRQIACGLVDTIGSYTFAKTLEYKAKQGLNSGNGKEVTVIPPAEYQERFLSALEKYFLACPDKWSRPLDGRKLLSDLNQLSSVL